MLTYFYHLQSSSTVVKKRNFMVRKLQIYFFLDEGVHSLSSCFAKASQSITIFATFKAVSFLPLYIPSKNYCLISIYNVCRLISLKMTRNYTGPVHVSTQVISIHSSTTTHSWQIHTSKWLSLKCISHVRKNNYGLGV